MNNIIHIGIDIGGVIRGDFDKSLSVQQYMAVNPLDNATKVIKSIIDAYGAENTFIISRCPKYAEKVNIKWLEKQKMFADIGFMRKNVYFCRERTDKAKIAKRLKLTHFIDDRVEVLDVMKDIVKYRILFTGGNNHEESNDKSIVALDSWDKVQNLLNLSHEDS